MKQTSKLIPAIFLPLLELQKNAVRETRPKGGFFGGD
jgi:hypothetical protein